MAAAARRTARPTVRVATIDDLFRARSPVSSQRPAASSAVVDELITELQARRLPKRVNTTIMLHDEASAVDGARIAALIVALASEFTAGYWPASSGAARPRHLPSGAWVGLRYPVDGQACSGF
jgi:hypothetical protein